MGGLVGWWAAEELMCSEGSLCRRSQNARSATRLKALRAGGNMISPADAKKINAAYEYNVKMWRQRKRKVRVPACMGGHDAC